MAILSKAYKPDNFESHNSLKLSFPNIRGLRLNFVDCESFFESNSPDILARCETNLYGSIDSSDFFVRVYLTLIRKESSTHMHGFSRSTHLLMYLSLETLTSIIRTGLPIMVELIDLVNSVIIFFISNDLTQMVNFLTQIPDCDSHSPPLLDFFLSSDASIRSTMAFSPLGNSDHVVVSISIDFHQIHNGMPRFIA